MSIGAVITFTLERRPERKWAWLGAVKSEHVPDAHLHIMSAQDGKRYPNIAGLIDAVVADGFPWFAMFKESEWNRPEHPHSKLGNLATTWSFLRAFRRVLELDVISLIMVDNYFLSKRWHHFENLIAPLQDLRILQMHHWDSRHHPDPKFRNDLFPRVPWYPNEVAPDISKGLAGAGDSVLILSPAGAAQLINWSETCPWFLIETLLWHYAHQGPQSGCYAVIKKDFDVWVDGRILLERWTGGPDSERTAINEN